MNPISYVTHHWWEFKKRKLDDAHKQRVIEGLNKMTPEEAHYLHALVTSGVNATNNRFKADDFVLEFLRNNPEFLNRKMMRK